MICPACKNTMVILEYEKIEIDFCPECKGIWLDKGELELIIGDRTETGGLFNSFSFAENVKEKKVRCPMCNKKMAKIVFSENKSKNLILDICNADGIWFDKGELPETVDKIHSDNRGKIVWLLNEVFNY